MEFKTIICNGKRSYILTIKERELLSLIEAATFNPCSYDSFYNYSNSTGEANWENEFSSIIPIIEKMIGKKMQTRSDVPSEFKPIYYWGLEPC